MSETIKSGDSLITWGLILSEISQLEERIYTALDALKAAPAEDASGEMAQQVETLEAEKQSLQEKLDKETRTHEALQAEFLDVCQDFGQMELDQISASNTASVQNDGLEELKRQRAKDIEDVDDILAKIAPLVEG